jgi:hypothetical protein
MSRILANILQHYFVARLLDEIQIVDQLVENILQPLFLFVCHLHTFFIPPVVLNRQESFRP